jgi:hypothetical protein
LHLYQLELKIKSKQLQMNSKVKVTADAAGNVVTPSKTNPEWGHIRVEQAKIVIDERGFARKKVISALIPGTIKDLKSFGWKANQEIEGTVIFKEQLTPFNPKEAERDYKVAGKTDVVCCIDGQPIYRKTFFKTESNAKDICIMDEQGNPVTHDNGEAIRAAYLAISEKEASEANTNIDLM